MNITKAKVISLRKDIAAALREVEQKHGVTVSLGNCRYTEAEARFTNVKVTAKVDESELINGVNPNTKEAKDWSFFTALHPTLGKLNVGDVVADPIRGDKLVIAGWNNRKRKDKVSLIGYGNGKKYKAPVSYAARLTKVEG